MVEPLITDRTPTGRTPRADDPRPPISEAPPESRESLGDFLAKHPVMTVAVAVCAGAIVANVLAPLLGGARSRSALERSALHQLRLAQRLDPYGDPLA